MSNNYPTKGKTNNLLDRLWDGVFKFLFPDSNRKRWLVLVLILLLSCLGFGMAYNYRLDNLNAYSIRGAIVKAGYSSSSGVGRTSGRTSSFYFKVKGYDAVFEMTDVLALGHIDGWMFKEGNEVEVGVLTSDRGHLQTTDHLITPIGLKVNGKEEVAIWRSLFNDIYSTYLYVSLPLALYLIITLVMLVFEFVGHFQRRKKNSLR